MYDCGGVGWKPSRVCASRSLRGRRLLMRSDGTLCHAEYAVVRPARTGAFHALLECHSLHVRGVVWCVCGVRAVRHVREAHRTVCSPPSRPHSFVTPPPSEQRSRSSVRLLTKRSRRCSTVAGWVVAG